MLRDVTDRERTTVALEQARRRFQQAFHSAPTGMALVRLDDSRIVDANQSLADMLDRPLESLIGVGIREITHPDDLRAAATQRARLDWASPTPICSNSATCAATVSSCGRALGCR